MLKLIISTLIAFLFVLGLTLETALANAEQDAFYLSFEQRLVLSQVLNSYQLPSEQKQNYLENRVSQWLSTFQGQPELVAVDSFSEFLTQFRGDWPSTGSLKEDLEILEKRNLRNKKFIAQSPELQQQIDAYISRQLVEVATLISGLVIHQGGANLSQVTRLEHLLVSEHLSLKQTILENLDASISQQMSDLDSVGKKIAEQKLKLNSDPMLQIFVSTLFDEYFKRLNVEVKKNIVADLLGKSLQLSDIDKLEILIQNSGPQFQKILQIIARQSGVSGDLMEILKKLEDSVRPVPLHKVEEIIKTEKKNFAFISLDKQPLGVGTMAQVHKALLLDYKGNKRDVVVRFLKPKIKDKVVEDHRILSEVAEILDSNEAFRKSGAPKLGPIVEDLTKTVLAELELQKTIDRQKQAKLAYENTAKVRISGGEYQLEFKVPEIYQSPSPSNLIVQERVSGKKIDAMLEQERTYLPEIKTIIVENLVTLWLKEALFGGGFYHADLHQGNMLVYKSDKHLQVTLLDYGMGGVLSAQMQEKMLLLGAGALLKKPNLLANALWDVSEKDKNKIDKAQWTQKVIEQMNQQNLSIEMWAAWATEQGLKFPYDFINMNRGVVILAKLLQSSSSNQTLTSLMKKLAIRHPFGVYRLLNKHGLSHAELLKIGWLELEKIRALPKEIEAVNIGINRCEAVFR